MSHCDKFVLYLNMHDISIITNPERTFTGKYKLLLENSLCKFGLH